MIDVMGVASLLSRVLFVPRLADDLVTARSRENAREALVDGTLRRRFYMAVHEEEGGYGADVPDSSALLSTSSRT